MCKLMILRLFGRTQMFFAVLVLCSLFMNPAHADIVDAYDLSPFVPLVLETMMNIATSLYKFFVGNGNGIIYILVYIFLAFYICLYLVKMYIPKDWLSFLGFSEGGDMWEGKADAWKITENILKPSLRAVIAIVLLLQIKPTYVTEWLVNPFLEFGSTMSILLQSFAIICIKFSINSFLSFVILFTFS